MTKSITVPSISVMIPTFNRAHYLRSALYAIRAEIDTIPCAEVVIADNCSTDDTMQVAQHMCDADPRFRYFRQPIHLPTAEQNIFTALSQCRNEFVWTVSDDDMLLPGAALTMFRTLMERPELDFILVNVEFYGRSGALRSKRFVPDEDSRHIADRLVTLRDIVRELGYIGLLTSASSTCYRRELVKEETWRRLLETSPIYAHAGVYYETYRDRPSMFVSAPLVRVYDDDGVAFEKISGHSSRGKAPKMWSWTVGLARLIAENDLDVGDVVEVGPFNKALLGDLMIVYVCTQIEMWLEKSSDQEILTEENVSEIANIVANSRLMRYQFSFSELKRAARLITQHNKIAAGEGGAAVARVLDGGVAGFLGLIREEIAETVARTRTNIKVLRNGPATEVE